MWICYPIPVYGSPYYISVVSIIDEQDNFEMWKWLNLLVKNEQHSLLHLLFKVKVERLSKRKDFADFSLFQNQLKLKHSKIYRNCLVGARHCLKDKLPVPAFKELYWGRRQGDSCCDCCIVWAKRGTMGAEKALLRLPAELREYSQKVCSLT